MSRILVLNNIDEVNDLNELLRPIIFNEDGSLKDPFQVGTTHVLHPFDNPNPTSDLKMCKTDARCEEFAQNNPEVLAIFQAKEVTQDQAQEFGWFQPINFL